MLYTWLQVTVQYHPDDVDSFIQLADAFEDAYPNLQVVGVEDDKAKLGQVAIKTTEGQLLRTLRAEETLSEADMAAIIDRGGYTVDQ